MYSRKYSWTESKLLLIAFCVTVEIATLTRQNDKTVIRILPPNEVQALISAHEKAEAEAEAAKKEKAQQKPT